jgi:chitinase
MAYDIWGSWSTTGVGPNAPLNDTCATIKAGSAVSAVQAWTAANFPANKIALGVAAYGHSFYVDKTAAVDSSGNLASYPPFDNAQQPHGDSEDGNAGVDQCGAQVPIGGIFNFWGLVDGGFLDANGTAASGINYRYENCSQTVSFYYSAFKLGTPHSNYSPFSHMCITQPHKSWCRMTMLLPLVSHPVSIFHLTC